MGTFELTNRLGFGTSQGKSSQHTRILNRTKYKNNQLITIIRYSSYKAPQFVRR